jgi:peptide chain release factor 2
LKRPLFRPPLARRGVARAEGGRAARSRPARSRADVLSFPSAPEWPRADRALGLAAVERETAPDKIFSAPLFSFFSTSAANEKPHRLHRLLGRPAVVHRRLSLLHSIDDARSLHAEAAAMLDRSAMLASIDGAAAGSAAAGGVRGRRTDLENALELCELAAVEGDAEVLDDGVRELDALHAALRRSLLELALRDPKSGEPPPSRAFLELQAAPGGGDTCYWLARLVAMYTAWPRRCAAQGQQGYSASLLSAEDPFGTQEYVGGHRSATLELRGPQVAGWLRAEGGVHCFKHVTPFGKQSKQTGFVRVTVIPAEDAEEQRQREEREQRSGGGGGGGGARRPMFSKEELKIETMRSSGPGGQHANTTDSCVRITHEPTGLVAKVSASRSQIENRTSALSLLEHKLRQAEREQRALDEAAARGPHETDTFGAQIRTYRFISPNIVHDHRTGGKWTDPNGTLDDAAELTDIMEATLLHQLQDRLETTHRGGRGEEGKEAAGS